MKFPNFLFGPYAFYYYVTHKTLLSSSVSDFESCIHTCVDFWVFRSDLELWFILHVTSFMGEETLLPVTFDEVDLISQCEVSVISLHIKWDLINSRV